MNRGLWSALLLAGTAFSTTAFAQVASAPTPATEGQAPAAEAERDPSDASADIVVTALKQGQTALQTAVTISILEPTALESKNIVAGNQLNAVVPGLTMSVGVGGLPGTSFRGLGSNSAVFGLEPSVAEYIDGVYQPHARDYVAPIYDVDHIEFIKGTQSTLLGKNTSLGAISIVNRRPKPTFGYDLQYTHSFAVEGDRLQAAVNAPLGDTLAVRAAFIASRQQGFVHNILTDRDEAVQTDLSGRLGIAWSPTTDIEVYASYQRDHRHLRGQSIEVLNDPTGTIAARAALTGTPFSPSAIGISASGSRASGASAPGQDPFDIQNSDRLNAIIDYRLGEFTLTSQTAYSKWHSPRLTDLDFTAANLFNLIDDERSKTFTQELRLASPTGGRVEGIVGLFYYFNRWTYGRIFGGAPSNSVGFALAGTASSVTDLPTRAYSAFASGTLSLIEGLKIDAGVRYTHEKKEGTFVRNTTGALTGAFPTTPFTTYTPQVTKPIDYNIGVRYEPTNTLLLYASYSKGSKSGGFQDAPTTVAGGPFAPETAYSSEVGAKLRFQGGYLTLAGFNTRVKGFQTSYTFGIGTPPVSQTIVGNSDVRARGAEANLSYAPVRGLTIGGNVVYSKSIFTADFPVSGAIGRKGDPLTRAPEWSGNATVDYEGDVGSDLTLFGGVRADFASKTLFQFLRAQPLAPFGEAHGTIDARLGLRSIDKNWEVAVVGTNLGDRRFVEFATAITAGGGAYYGSYNRPRVIALQLTLKN